MAILIHHNIGNYSTPDEKKVIPFLEELIENEDQKVGEINIIFTDNSEILDLNKTYLDHNYYTDVIAFDYTEGNTLSGDIFISLEKVDENSKGYNTTFKDETLRVMFHGILHLSGYTDKTSEQKQVMHSREDYYLKQFYSKQ